MANKLKYSTIPDITALRKGNFSIGVTDGQNFGPTWYTDFFTGRDIKEAQYVIYNFDSFYQDLFKSAIRTHVAFSDEDLIAYLSALRGSVMTGLSESLQWAASNDNVLVFSSNVSNTIIEGLVLDLDGSQEASLAQSNGTWYDLSIQQNNPQFIGGVSYTSAGLRGLSLDGNTGRGIINTPTARDTNELTYEVWFKGGNVGWDYIIHNNVTDFSVGNSYLTMGVEGTTGTYFASLNGVSAGMASGVPVDSTNIYQMVLTWDGETQKVYINGELKNSDPLTQTNLGYSDWSPQTGIGAALIPNSGDRRWFTGDIYSIRAWDRGLSATEVSTSYYDRINSAKLLDVFPSAAAAYSVRSLSSEYDGPLIRVRRSIDDVESDFYPDTNGEISMTSTNVSGESLESWIAAGNDLPADRGTGAAASYGLRYVTDNNVKNSRRSGSYEDLAVAYSLRHVTNDYKGPVIRVRRSSDDLERDFLPWEITNGYLSDWVNTKSDSGSDSFPADYGSEGATAAYSLRYVTEKYTGPVIRVRRDVDDQERDFTPDEIEDGSLTSWVGPSNVMTYSDTYSSWGGPNVVLTTGQSDPFGGSNATKIAATNTGTNLERAIANSSVFERTEQWTLSGYFKEAGNDWVILRSNVNGNWRAAWFNVADGSVGTVQADISNPVIEYVRDGWYKCSVTFNGPRTSSVQLHTVLSNGTFGYNGNGTDGMLLTRVQVNDGTSTGEYVETSNTPVYGDGYVTTWYDQSGNDYDATQSTASQQPIINIGSELITENNKPIISFGHDGVNLTYLQNTDIPKSGDINTAIFNVSRMISGSGDYLYDGFNSPDYLGAVNSSRGITFNYSSQIPDDYYVFSRLGAVGGTLSLYKNGSLHDSGSGGVAGDDGITIGVTRALSIVQTNKTQELIIYTSDQTGNRQSIESNLNSYYDVYTTTPSASVTVWYDQSGNGHDATQTTADQQPLIYESGDVTKTNGVPAVKFAGSRYFYNDTINITNTTYHTFFSGELSTYNDNTYIYDSTNRHALTLDGFGFDGNIGNLKKTVSSNNGVAVDYDMPVGSHILSALQSLGTGSRLYDNSIDVSDITPSASYSLAFNDIYIGARFQLNAGQFWQGTQQELLIYNGDKSQVRAGIEHEMNQYYSSYSEVNPELIDSVVRVRRSIDDSERDFTPTEIESGVLVDWVNVKSDQDILPADYGSGSAAAYSLRKVSNNLLEGTNLPADYGNAAAAYSLRYVKSDYTGDVIVARRSIDEEERGFTPNEISSGELEAWANASGIDDRLPADYGSGAGAAFSLRKVSNAKQVPTVLPGDYGVNKAAAAYSLRQVMSDYEGPVVEVRRSSDDAERVFYDYEILDGTLANWVGEEVNLYTSDFTSGGTDALTTSGGTKTVGVTVSGLPDCAEFTTDNSLGQHFLITDLFNADGATSKVFAQVYIPSTNAVLDGVRIWTGFSGDGFVNVTDTDVWVNVSFDITAVSGGSFRFQTTAAGQITFTGNSNDKIFIKNVSVDQTTANGYVTAFYDQSLNRNDAVQNTASAQPLLVDLNQVVLENGKPAIRFDGVDDYLIFSSVETLDSEFLISSVFNSNPTTTWGLLLQNQTLSSDRIRLYDDGIIQIRINSTALDLTNAYTPNSQELFILQRDSLDRIDVYTSGESKGGGTLSGTWTGILGYVGSNQDQISGQFFAGNIQELITYNSDQLTNKEDIEFNINQYYGIYDQWDRQSVISVRRSIDDLESVFTPEEILDGTLTSWVNGNDILPGSRSENTKAVYSLRSAADDYDGPVVRVRRDTDNLEKDFNAVEVEDGTLEEWVTSPTVIYESNFSASNDGWAVTNVTLANSVTFEGESDVLEITLNSSGGAYQITKNPFFDINKTYKIEFDYYLPITGLTDRILVTGGISTENGVGFTKGDWYTNTIEYFKPSVVSTQLRFQAGDGVNFYSDTGAKIYIKNFKLTELDPTDTNGFVSMWHDQSRSGLSLVQTTEANQPQLVNAGSLNIENGKPAIAFNGSSSWMRTERVYPTVDDLSVFYVASSSATNQRVLDTRGTGISGTLSGWQTKFSNGADVSTLDSGSSSLDTTNIIRTGQNQVSVIGGLTSLNEWTNGSLSKSDTGSLTTFNSGNQLYVGTNANGQNTQFFNGNLQEIVIVNDDMTSDREVIEASQNFYYGVFENTSDGQVSIWYDQSGNDLHAVQATASQQPYIVRYGGLIKQDNAPGIFFDESTDQELDLNGATLSQWSAFLLLGILEPTAYGTLLGANNAALIFHNIIGFCYDDLVQNYNVLVDDLDIDYNRQTLLSAHATGTTITGFKNSVQELTVTPPGGDTDLVLSTINGEFAGNSGTATFQEVLIYNQNLEIAGFRDNIEASIGYSYDTFNTSTEAFVTTWYDQSGNSRNVSNSTASGQPKIVQSGELVLSNGNPAIIFDGVDDTLNVGSINASTTHVYSVQQTGPNVWTTLNKYEGFWSLTSAGSNTRALKYGTPAGSEYIYYYNSGGVNLVRLITDTYEEQFFTSILNRSTGITDAYFNNDLNSATIGTTPARGVALGKSNGNEFANVYIQEFVLFDQETRFNTEISSNILGYYQPINSWDNQSVVRVRRSSDEAERSFTPLEVSDGTIESWVNESYILINEDFSSDIGWSFLNSTSNINGGKLNFNTLVNDYAFFSYGKVEGQTVSIEYTISNYASGSVFVVNFGGGYTGVAQSSNGTVTLNDIVIGVGGNQNWGFRAGSSGFNGSIDNFKVTIKTSTGYVTTLYDQSGSGNHATQGTATAQPIIVDAGTQVIENTQPAFKFDGINNYLDTTVPFAGNITAFNVLNVNTGGSFPIVLGNKTNIARVLISNSSTNNWYQYYSGQTTLAGSSNSLTFDIQHLVSVLKIPTASNGFIYDNSNLIDGTSVVTTDMGGNIQIGAERDGDFPFIGTMQEIIIYDSDQTSNRLAIESNTNEYYGIYNQTADGYVSALYNQSKKVKYRSDYRYNTDGAVPSNGSLSINSGELTFTFTGGNVPHNLRLYGEMISGRSYNITFEYYIPASSVIDELRVLDSTPTHTFNTKNLWSTATITSSVWNSVLFRVFPYSSGGSTINADGDSFLIRNVVIQEDGVLTPPSASEQPLLVLEGNLIREGNRPAIYVNDGDSLRAPLPDYTDFDTYFVTRTSDTTYLYPSKYINGGGSYGMVAEDNSTSNGNGSSYGNPVLYKNGTEISAYTRDDIYEFYKNTHNVVSHIGASTVGWAGIRFSGYGGSFNFKGTLQEWILYDSDTSTNRISIESNLDKYYDVYGQNIQGFVSAWYDQSGNNYNLLQSSAGIQPRIVVDSTIYTLNNKPAIYGETNDYMSGGVSFGTTSESSIYYTGAWLPSITTENSPLIAMNTGGYSGGDNSFVLRGNVTNRDFVIRDGIASQTISNGNVNGNQVTMEGYFVSGGKQTLWVNGISETRTNTLGSVTINDTIDLFVYNNNGSFVGREGGIAQEVLVYLRDIENDRLGIIGNINSKYN